MIGIRRPTAPARHAVVGVAGVQLIDELEQPLALGLVVDLDGAGSDRSARPARASPLGGP